MSEAVSYYAALDADVARMVAEGYSVESRTPTQAVLVKKSRIGWFWNTVLVLVTGGLWLIVVAYRLVNRKSSRVVITIGPDGRIHRS